MEELKDAQARQDKKSKNPFQNAGILSKLFFTWTFPLFYKGYKRGLVEDDIFHHLKSHDSEVQGDKLESEWRKEMSKDNNNPSLWKVLIRVYGKELMLLGIVSLISEILRILLPLALDRFLDYYEPNSKMTLNDAYLYAGLVSLTTLAQVVITHQFMFYILHLAQKIRSGTSSLVYRKSIRLSKSALVETTIGQMVNLISNDVSRFELCTVNIHSLWLGPTELIAVLILLYFYVGFTGLPGAGLLLCFIPFQMWMGKKTSLYRLKTALRTDERIRLMNEIITGMQVIKMYTWEKPFEKLVKLIRINETNEIKKNLEIRGIMMAFNVFLTRAVIASCVLTYVLTGNKLNAKYVYVVSLFFEILRQSINQGFTSGVTEFAEANISVRRIRDFLMYDEFESQNHLSNSIDLNISTKTEENESKIIGSIKLSNVSVKWIKSDKEYAMKNINFEVGTRELATVIGKVGSGKSTLLHVILQELPSLTGSVNINGSISYASQESWLFMSSVRQNILFGQEYNAERYNKVIEVCGLERDLRLFPYGDRTLVGERGISLSGGQKARINLARAIYKEADIYLLDDPLSAVDTHVGKHIFEKCITEYLKDKCVVLITHQLQYLNDCKKIYLLKDGTVDYFGTYDEIKQAGKEFTVLVKEFEKKMEEEAKKDAKDDALQIREDLDEIFIDGDSGEGPTIEKEGKVKGKVTWAVYKYYFLSGGHWCKILALFLIFVISQALASGTDYFLTIWVNVEQLRIENNSTNTTDGLLKQEDNGLLQNFWYKVLDEQTAVITYGILVATVVILLTIRSIIFFRYCLKSSIKMHDGMFSRIVHTTMRFFNVNPSGRILNRFSKDMNQVDEYLPLVFSQTLQIGLMGAAITIVVATLTPFILLPTAIILVIFYLLRIVFIATTRDIKRFEAITSSPVYSHLTASLQGLTTIRAFGAQDLLRQEFDNLQNAYNSAYFMFLAANRTFGYWLDMHTVVFVTLVTYSFLFLSHETFGGNVGLAITQAITLTGLFQFGIRQWSEMENTMTSVERIKEYTEVLPESDLKIKELPRIWPENGNIRFENLSLRYASKLPYVLKKLTFNIKGNEKVGIVGRTGAGKSSLISALFRLVDTEGKIIIDDVDTKTAPLNILRSNISIIPQEPILFSGTMKKNLDPFDEYNDEVIWNALEEVKLKQVVSDLPLGLESKMSEGGSNFSVGQRQLVCLARALIRSNKILVLDEATANVDPYTDGLIQSTIRNKFADCTVLTIAHRLHTIMDSDKVLVMDAGEVIEFGQPCELLQNTSGVFYGMVQQTGRAMADNLISIAKNANKIS